MSQATLSCKLFSIVLKQFNITLINMLLNVTNGVLINHMFTGTVVQNVLQDLASNVSCGERAVYNERTFQ